MVIDSLINPQTLLQPRSFAGLITLYESNFLRLSEVGPDLSALNSAHPQQRSTGSDGSELLAEFVEVSRFTLTFNLTYLFEEGGRKIREPDMLVRLYLDANLVEAKSISSTCINDFMGTSIPSRVELDSRWARNTMLNKWLEFCTDQGHSLSAR